jgi:hypothetical protein
VKTQAELEAELRALGWSIDGPKRTSGGWKATIQRDTVYILATRETEVAVLEVLLCDAKARDAQPRKGQP